MSFPHPSINECLLLIKMKRERAKASLQRIVSEFGLPPHHVPSVLTILEYLTGMVYCIELQLKLLSDNWRTHDVAAMYQKVAGRAASA